MGAPRNQHTPSYRRTVLVCALDMGTSEFVREFVIDSGLSLEIGESIRTICPVCRATHENSFQVQRDSLGLSYRCWRVSCGCSGKVWSNGRGAVTHTHTGSNKAPRPFTLATTSLPSLVLDIVEEKYNLSKTTLDHSLVRWCEELESLVFPCYNLEGTRTGTVTKRLFKKDGAAKSLLFWTESPPQYFVPYKQRIVLGGGGKLGRVYVVEDCLSALRMFEEGDFTVALLGTTLHSEVALSLSSGFRTLMVCLDPDAVEKAAKIATECRLLFDEVRIVVPKKDPKDLSPEELRSMLCG